MIYTDKKVALETYKETKKIWMQDKTEENWRRFCEAKRTCMMLGVRI